MGNYSLIGLLIAILFAYYMGLYTNDIPDVGVDGFTSKIRENIKYAKVDPLSEKNIVKICQSIPITNTKIKDIIKNNRFRPLTKPKNIGGSDDILEDSTVTPAVTPAVTPVVTPAVTPAVTPVVTPVVTPAVTPVVTPAVTPAQTGGKKNNSLKPTKKYNIRLV